MNVSLVTYHLDPDELRSALDLVGSADCVDCIDVIDNGSDDSVKQICASYDRVTYFPHSNHGYGAAHNVALRRSIASGAKYHLVMNTDMTFSPADLALAEAYMDAHPDVALLHPRIVGLDGADQFTVRMLPTPLDLVLRRFVPSWVMPKRRRRYLLQHLDHTRPFDAAYVQGSFMLLRTDVLSRVGLFDERFFMYPEDIDLTRRVARVARATYWPGITVVHAHRGESYRSLRMLRIHMSNMVRYFNKWGWWHDPERRHINRRFAAIDTTKASI